MKSQTVLNPEKLINVNNIINSRKIFPNNMIEYTFLLIVLLQFFSLFQEINSKSLMNKNLFRKKEQSRNKNFNKTNKNKCN